MITTGLSNEDEKKLRWLCKQNEVSFDIFAMDEQLLHPYDGIGTWPKFTFMKLFIAQFLPTDIERCLYLDVDLLVLGNLAPIFDIHLGENAVAGVLDYPVVDLDIKRCKLGSKAAYINSGVMVLNLPLWRKAFEENAFERFVQTKQNIMSSINDQDVINSVFEGKVQVLSPSYNVTNFFFGIRNPLLKKGLKAQWLEGRRNAKIMHFVCGRKPWIAEVVHPYKALWFETLRRTPYKGYVDRLNKRNAKQYVINYFKNVIANIFDYFRLL